MLSPRINFRFFEVPMDNGIVTLLEIPCAEKVLEDLERGYIFSHEEIVQYIMTIIPQEEVIVDSVPVSRNENIAVLFAKVSRLINNAVDTGYIKVMDPDTAPRYKKYIPYWA